MSKSKEPSPNQQRRLDVLRQLAEIRRQMDSAPNSIPGGTGPVTMDLAVAVSSGRPELVLIPTELGTLEQFQSAYRVVKSVLQANALLQRHALLLGQLIEDYRAAAHHTASKADDIWLMSQFKEPDEVYGDEG